MKTTIRPASISGQWRISRPKMWIGLIKLSSVEAVMVSKKLFLRLTFFPENREAMALRSLRLFFFFLFFFLTAFLPEDFFFFF